MDNSFVGTAAEDNNFVVGIVDADNSFAADFVVVGNRSEEPVVADNFAAGTVAEEPHHKNLHPYKNCQNRECNNRIRHSSNCHCPGLEPV